MQCPRCHAAIAADARFCPRCGTRLLAVAAPRAAERRQLTVLFCDLVGSTALSVRLDPEDLRAVMRAYHEYVSEAVSRFGGVVTQISGDGMLAHFGWPQAHEHDAERAVRAGLALVGQIAERPWPFGVELAVRVGIATGLVLVDSSEVMGETPNLAARLQTQAEPNTVLIAPATLGLVRGLFEYRDIGERHLKGFAEPMRLWQVVGESKVAGRFEALHGNSHGALIGRDQELAALIGLWQQAREGAGQVVLLTGDAGIGKSRLTRALSERVAGDPHRRLRYFCSPHYTDSALRPVIAQIERVAGFDREDSAAMRLGKLKTMLSYLATPPADAALIADLLSLEGDAGWPRPDLAPTQRRQRTLDALRRMVEAQTGRMPILAVFEDVHWIDPTSLELLDRTVASLERLPVLLIVTARPGFEAPWAHQRHASEIALGRLDRSAAAELVREIGTELSGDMARDIVEQADGVPLFIEELTRAVVEGGKEASPAAGIPTSLQGSLMSRLDRLGPAKELAQLAAVIGRRFSWALLSAIADRSTAELETGLQQLIATGLVLQQGAGAQRLFRFKHALVQGAAYESLLRSARQQLHVRVAATLEARFPATLPEQVAEHWAQAGEAARAAECWLKAGEQAIRRGANREATALLARGLDALMRVAESNQRDRSELALQLALAEALIADRGWTAAETQPCWTRARELCERTGETAALFPILYGQFSTSLSRGAPDAHDLAEQALRLTSGSRDAGLYAVAHAMVGMSHFARGKLSVARVEFEVALSLSSAARGPSTFLAADHNIAITSLWLAMTLLLLGDRAAAASHAAAGLDAARRLDNPHTMAHALALHCRYLSIADDVPALHVAAEDLALLAAEHRFPFYTAAADIYRGWVLAEHDIPRGLRMLRDGTDAFVALGATALRPWFRGRMAVLEAAQGKIGGGLDLLDQALAEIDRSGQRWCEGELQRLGAELRTLLSRSGEGGTGCELGSLG
jgi:class 3 adenylate cyclase